MITTDPTKVKVTGLETETLPVEPPDPRAASLIFAWAFIVLLLCVAGASVIAAAVHP